MILRTDKRRVPFQIDRRDFEAVRRYPWTIAGAGYPYTSSGKGPRRRPIPLHVFLMGRAPDGLEWDHRNRDKLDNRRRNLRAVPPVINRLNRSWRRLVGVSRFGRKWRARIGKRHLGLFASRSGAAAARRKAERRLFREGE